MTTAYERGTKAVDFAADVVKQLLTLSTGILALTITFATDIVGDRETPTVLLGISWIAYILSILFGLWALFAMTGELEQLPAKGNNQGQEPSIRGRNVTLPAILQIVTFLGATAFIAAYGLFALGAPSGAQKPSPSPTPTASATPSSTPAPAL
jgi:hypothetical protein